MVNSLSAGKNGNVLKANTILTTVFTSETTNMGIVKNTSTIQGLNALNGLITADTIMAVANTTADGSTINSNADGSTFVNLQIAGNVINANVPPNTTIDLPGIGNVILNRETTSGNGTSKGSIVVEMIAINVTLTNSFGLPVGAQVIVAHASSGFTRLLPGAAIVSGSAWATSANAAIGNLLANSIGLTAFVTMGCTGTGGKTLTNKIQQLSVSPVLSLGTGVTTAFGGPTVSGADAKTTATLQSVGLLNGLISATTVTAVAETTIAGGVRTRSTAGSGFVGLTVLGLPVPVNVPPNTNIALPGIGYVILNEQIIPPASSNAETQVNGIHIFITTINLLLLPVGAEVIVAHAAAGADNL